MGGGTRSCDAVPRTPTPVCCRSSTGSRQRSYLTGFSRCSQPARAGLPAGLLASPLTGRRLRDGHRSSLGPLKRHGASSILRRSSCSALSNRRRFPGGSMAACRLEHPLVWRQARRTREAAANCGSFSFNFACLVVHPCSFSVVAANSAPVSVDLLISLSGGTLSNATLVLPPGGDFYELSLNFTAPATVVNATLTIVVDGTALGPSLPGGVVTLNATSLLPAAIAPSAVRADVVEEVSLQRRKGVCGIQQSGSLSRFFCAARRSGVSRPPAIPRRLFCPLLSLEGCSAASSHSPRRLHSPGLLHCCARCACVRTRQESEPRMFNMRRRRERLYGWILGERPQHGRVHRALPPRWGTTRNYGRAAVWNAV